MGKRGTKTFKTYVAATADEYELPLIVGTWSEIAAYLGLKRATIDCAVSRGSILRYGDGLMARVFKVDEKITEMEAADA